MVFRSAAFTSTLHRVCGGVPLSQRSHFSAWYDGLSAQKRRAVVAGIAAGAIAGAAFFYFAVNPKWGWAAIGAALGAMLVFSALPGVEEDAGGGQ